jgi:hypothetical protein
MRKIHLLAALTATTLMLGAAGVRADEPAKPADAKTAPAVQAGKKLTDDDLVKMIEDLGYEVTRLPQPGDAVKRVQIKVTRGNFDCPMNVNLGGDGQSTLLSFVNLGVPSEAALADAPKLMKLLQQNDGFLDGGRVQFRMNPKTKAIFLARTTENRGITPKLLREHIEQTVAAAYDTQELWDHSKWGKGDTKTETKTEPKAEQKASK